MKEGPRRTIGSLSFPGAKVIGADELRRIAKLAEGKPYVPGRDAEAAGEIRKAYSRRGYDEATVTPRPGAPDDEGRVPLAFEIVEGTAYRLGEITVRGNTKTTTRKILSIGDERPGKPLDSVQLAEHQSHLSRLGVFDTVSVTSAPVPGSSPPEKSVLVDVVERSTRYVEYGLDINTQRGLELAGTLGERNLFGNATNGSLLGPRRQEAAELRPRDRPAVPLRDPPLQHGEGDVHLGHDLRRLLPADDRGPGRALVGVRPEAHRDARLQDRGAAAPRRPAGRRGGAPSRHRDGSGPSRRASRSTSATTRS